MRHPPRDPGERILDARRLFAVGRAGAVMATGTVTFAGIGPRASARTRLTMSFTTFVLFQLFNALHARADNGPLLGGHKFRNRTMWLCLAGVFAVQAIAVHVPWTRTVVGTLPLNRPSGPYAWGPRPPCSASNRPCAPHGQRFADPPTRNGSRRPSTATCPRRSRRGSTPSGSTRNKASAAWKAAA
nr:cation-translocating P-type ATPase C-terminal domain-containing protein [Streptomyces sp. HUCO-GS316]